MPRVSYVGTVGTYIIAAYLLGMYFQSASLLVFFALHLKSYFAVGFRFNAGGFALRLTAEQRSSIAHLLIVMSLG